MRGAADILLTRTAGCIYTVRTRFMLNREPSQRVSAQKYNDKWFGIEWPMPHTSSCGRTSRVSLLELPDSVTDPKPRPAAQKSEHRTDPCPRMSTACKSQLLCVDSCHTFTST